MVAELSLTTRTRVRCMTATTRAGGVRTSLDGCKNLTQGCHNLVTLFAITPHRPTYRMLSIFDEDDAS